MCGRTRCTIRADGIPRACIRHGRSVRSVDMDRYRPSYNVSPGWNMPVIRRGDTDDEVVLHCMKWGLVPSFTKKTEKPDHYKMFNARSESISEKPSFRRLVPNNRCLVVVEGFYEWKKDGSKKQPYYIHFKSSQPLVFAALYDYWKNSEGEVLYTFTILTTSSSSALRWLHDRMPVILGDEKAIDAWLDGSTSKFDGVLKPYEEPELVWYPVTAAMGKASFDGPQCIEEVKLKTEATRPISNFFTKRESDKKESNTEVEESVTHLSNPYQPKHLKEEPENADLQRLVEVCHQKILKKEPETVDSRETKEPNAKKESDGHGNGDKQQTQQHISKEESDIQSSSSIKEPALEEDHIKKECNIDHKVVDAVLSKESILRSPWKRAHEISTVNEKSNCQTEKQHRSPVKKKGRDDKQQQQQPTLFSYFGKR